MHYALQLLTYLTLHSYLWSIHLSILDMIQLHGKYLKYVCLLTSWESTTCLMSSHWLHITKYIHEYVDFQFLYSDPKFFSMMKKVPIHRCICITQVYPKSIWRLLFCICAKYQRFLPIRNHTMAKHNFQSKIKWDFLEFWTK